MGKGVFIHRTDSIYDDSPAERYQFPRSYLSRVEACVGDWIIYLEPSKARGSRGYFAVAKVDQVIPDPALPDMYIAIISPGSYLEFARSVPFRTPDRISELGLLNESGRISGRAQSAVRPISESDFEYIMDQGLDETVSFLPRLDHHEESDGVREDQTPFEFGNIRDRVNLLSSRIVRDRVFRRVVLRAYDERCAFTGLKLINGGGRAEVEAAHIKAVGANGPDIVTNGIALSGTVHWMFDRGLISLSDNLDILISRQVNDPGGVASILNKTGRATAPLRPLDRPHPSFLKWHRENCFKH